MSSFGKAIQQVSRAWSRRVPTIDLSSSLIRADPTRKPPEMYTLIENFCLGLRRLEVFGRPYSLRQGWVTAGDFELTPEMMEETKARPWDPSIWEAELPRDGAGRALVPTSQGTFTGG